MAPNKASIKTPMAIPTAVNIDTIVIPCSLKSVLTLLPRVHFSLSKNVVIDLFGSFNFKNIYFFVPSI